MMDYLIIFFAEYLLYLSLLAVPYLWFGDKRHDLIRIGLSVIFAYALAEGLHLLFPVAR
ncbi:hypothetical protein GTO10_01280, partial [Candidatus Saccharibacteria bacterium]|nr:hypothetical protein [Candidatus Saccharibacteria bacterium]